MLNDMSIRTCQTLTSSSQLRPGAHTVNRKKMKSRVIRQGLAESGSSMKEWIWDKQSLTEELSGEICCSGIALISV